MAPTAGSRWSWAALGVLLGVGLAQACATPEEAEDDLTVSALLRDVATLVIRPALAAFHTEATALSDSLTAGDALADVQQAWIDTMRAWQRLEVMQVGPAGSSLTAVGGQDLRDAIYSWPSVNPCRVDQVTADQSFTSDSFFDDNLVNAYGLDAIEYALWASPDNACPPQVDINTSGTWSSLGDAEVASRRYALATVLATDVADQADALQGAWDDGFAEALEQATDPYASQAEALEAVFHGIFYLDTVTRDRKLAQPMGREDCSAETCPEDVEVPYARLGGTMVAENLRGTRDVFRGNPEGEAEGVGFDDLLIERGHSALASQILADLDAAITLADTHEDLAAALQADPAALDPLFDAIKKVTDALKGDFVTVLSLQVPSHAAGDTD